MPAGRPPIPTNIHKLRGTKRAYHDRRNEPELPAGVPKAPAWLDAIGKRCYTTNAAILTKAGVLTAGDYQVLASYALTWSNIVHARAEVVRERKQQAEREERWGDLETDDATAELEKRIRKLEQRAVGESPWVKALKDERLLLVRLGTELGLSPSSRSKVRASEPPRQKSEMEELLGLG